MSAFRITLVFVLLALAGVLVVPSLSLNLTPTPSAPAFSIAYSFPGMPPLTVEREVTSVIENAISGIPGIKSISSVSRHGSGYVQLEFERGEDLAFRQQQIFSTLRQLSLPREVGRPLVRRQTQHGKAHDPLLIFELRYPANRLEQAEHAVQTVLLPRLASMEGVSTVEVSGLAVPAVQVAYWPDRLLAMQMTPLQIQERIRQAASDRQIALARQNDHWKSVVVNARMDSLQQVGQVALSHRLTLADVAEVSMYQSPIMRRMRVNGQEAAFLSVYANPDVNRLKLAGEIKKSASLLRASLPPDCTLSLQVDDSSFLSQELGKAGIRSGLAFLFIAFFALLGYRSWHHVALLSASLLVNLGLVSLVAAWLHIEIHLYTLAGLAISFGLVVDNSIMTIDAYQAGRPGKLLLAQLAASATTLAALAVVMLLPFEYRQDLTELVLIVSASLCTSFLVSWWFIPALATQLGMLSKAGRKKPGRFMARMKAMYGRWLYWVAHKRIWVACLLIWAFGLPVYFLPAKVDGWNWYNATLGSETYRETIRPHVDKWLGGTSRVFYRNVYERSQFRAPEKTRLYVQARLPYGHTLEQMDHTIRKVEDYLASFPQIERYVTQVFSGQRASITVEFKPEDEQGDFPYILKNRLTSRAIDWGGVEWGIYGVGRGFSNASGDAMPNFRVTLKGYDYDKLGQYAEELKAHLIRHPRIQQVDTDARADWNDQNFERLTMMPRESRGAHFLSTVETARLLATQNSPSGQIIVHDRLYPLYLEPATGPLTRYRAMMWASENAPMAAVAELHQEKGANAIYREERQYIRTVSFDYYGSYRFGDNFLDETLKTIKPTLPLGYTMEKREWTWDWRMESNRYGMIILAMALILLVGILYTGHFGQAVKVLLAIPCAYIGLFVTFGWGGFPFDQGGYAAFLFLTGLSVNALLFILSEWYRLKQRGGKAFVKALSVKLWPVLLTVLSTIFGFIPFLVYGPDEVFWFSLAVGTIGGLTLSFLLVFFVLPAFWIRLE